jgi:protease IV
MSEALAGTGGRGANPTVVVQTGPGIWRSWIIRLLLAALALSILINFSLYSAWGQYFQKLNPPSERFHSGSTTSADKILYLEAAGTIMPPLTGRLLKSIEQATKDDDIKGVLLVVDSPGGFVADSHQIYHRLLKLQQKKPVYVQMKRLAASGGYYISMGAGPNARIYAEPTTWTGSIGVIIPRYDASTLAAKIGVSSDPLKTGEFKDALSPFKPLSEGERAVWENVLTQSYDQFIDIIDENRPTLDRTQVKALATGQIYTAKDALKNGLVDEIAFEDEALDGLAKKLGITSPQVVEYSYPVGLLDILTGEAKAPANPWSTFIEGTIPRAMYYFSWLPMLPQ